MEFPNGKQRRAWARKTGHLKKKQNASFGSWLEMIRRSRETGNQIHTLNVERNLREQEEAKLKEEQQFIQKRVEAGVDYQEALKELENRNGNLDIERK
jgi:Flp pilus assembly protein TadB